MSTGIDLYLAAVSTVEAIAVCIASGMAVYGIRTWRKEMLGKRKIELAEETIEKFHAARDSIAFARFIYADAGEGQSRPEAEGEDPNTKQRRDSYFVAAERLSRRSELFNRIATLRYLMKAHFGDKVDQPFNTLLQVRNEIVIASQWLAARTGSDRRWWQTTTGSDGAVGPSELRQKWKELSGIWIRRRKTRLQESWIRHWNR